LGLTGEQEADRMSKEKTRENRLRRMAARQGLQLTRSRRRDPRAIDFGGFMLIDIYRDTGIMGDQPYAFSATLDDVEAYLKGEDEQAA
jgi:hypothetical protein